MKHAPSYEPEELSLDELEMRVTLRKLSALTIGELSDADAVVVRATILKLRRVLAGIEEAEL